MRPDLVDIALAGSIAAARYVAPLAMVCSATRTPMRLDGTAAAVATSELLHGEGFAVFEIVAGWAFGQSVANPYVGWVAVDALAAIPDRSGPPIAVTAALAPMFSAPDIKAPVLCELPFGALLDGAAGDRFFALDGGGFVHMRHLAPLDRVPIAVARRFAGAPYLWGGRTPAGVDCSGLVQAALAACGMACPRDSDQQLAELGTAVEFDARSAGDLVFFPGHVGILADDDRLFHANAHWMATVEEPLADVIARLVAAGSPVPVTGVRRLNLSA